MSFQPLSRLLYFFAWRTLFKLAMFLFCSGLTPILGHLRNLFLLSAPFARMLLTPKWVSGDEKCEIVIHIFINSRTTFSLNSHLVEEATFYTLVWFGLNYITICLCKDPNVEFHSNARLLFISSYFHEFGDRES